MKTQRKRIFFGAILLVLVTALGGATASASGFPYALYGINYTDAAANERLYKAAVIDSMVIDGNEIKPLVDISAGSEMCTWDAQGRVLMLTHHAYPDSYVAGEEYTLSYGEVWTFTDQLIISWYRANKRSVRDWALRFKQLIGLPADREYTYFSAVWVNPRDITRPAYEWELTDTVGAASFAEEPTEEFKAWFDGNIIWSYFDSAYPWTRLGYTYGQYRLRSGSGFAFEG